MKEKGTSLIEIILIVVVAGMIILVISNLPNAINLIGVSENESTAKQIAAKRLSDIRSVGYDNLANGSTSISDTRFLSIPASSGTVLVEDCPPQVCTNGELTKKVTITIDWKENSKSKNFSLVTLISQGGLK